MAGKRLSWVFTLFDRFSPSARKIGKSVEDVERKLKKTSTATERARRATERHTTSTGKATGATHRHSRAVEGATRATRRLGDAHKHAGMHGSSFFLKLTGWYMSMQMGIMMVRGLASALFGLPTAFAKAGLSAAAFKEQSLLGLGTMLGSPGAGASLFAEADRMAKATGTPLREMVDRYSQLTAMGFQGERLRQVLAGVGDLAIVGGQDKASRALLAITQIKAKGRLSAEELMQQLAETGVDIDAVYGILGRRTGLAKPALLKALEKGQIGSDLGIDAVLEFIQNRYSGGKLGSMAAKYAKTGPGLWANLKSAPDRFLMDLDQSAGYQKAKTALENLVAVLDPETPQGKRLKAKATEMFDKIFGGVFDRFQDPQAVEKWVEKVIEGVGKMIPAVERLATSVGTLAANFDKVIGAIEWLRKVSPAGWFSIALENDVAGKVGGAASRFFNTPLPPAPATVDPKVLMQQGRTPPKPVKKWPGANTTSMQFGPGAFQIQINGAQDPTAVGDEVEERMASLFERLGIAQGVA